MVSTVTRSKQTKSRSKLYKLIQGVNKLTTGGKSAVGSIQFANIPVAGETVTIGGYWFQAQAGATEAPGTSAGTQADPHLFQSITNLATAGASLAACILAETATTGAWGYLHPVDATGVDFTTDTLTLTFWPGTWGNAVTLAGSAGDETIVQPVTASLGVNAPIIDLSYSATDINNTGSAGVDFYTLEDGTYAGQRVFITCSTFDTNEPRILGKFNDTAAKVYVAFSATNEYLQLVWTGNVWRPADLTGGAAFVASA